MVRSLGGSLAPVGRAAPRPCRWEAAVPDDQELLALLACEERAGATEPYRRVAALTHVLAERA
jgi:hypothetical protein